MSAPALPSLPGLDVSRETYARLETHLRLLAKWNQAINLVARSTLPDAWTRHVADSAQLISHAPADARTWLDLGSGAGFPGLVIAAIAAERRPALRLTLVESDQRKAAFLAAAAREMGLAPAIRADRAEALPPEPHCVVSARALAPLPRLLALAARFTGPETVLLFPKGSDADRELTAAEADWHYHLDAWPSLTNPGARILRFSELRPRS